VHLFCNGHVYFIQRTPQTLGIVPFAVHATFQLSGNPGKQNRMREHHLWLVDEPSYYSDGNFIGYEDVLPVDLLSYQGHTQVIILPVTVLEGVQKGPEKRKHEERTWVQQEEGH